MAHIRKGLLTKPSEWAKHLRKFWKKTYWGKERKPAQKAIFQQMKQESDTDFL